MASEAMTTTRMNEIAFYGLAGAPQSPRELIDEVRLGESLGFGSVFISERFNIKEAATLCGAAAAVGFRLLLFECVYAVWLVRLP